MKQYMLFLLLVLFSTIMISCENPFVEEDDVESTPTAQVRVRNLSGQTEFYNWGTYTNGTQQPEGEWIRVSNGETSDYFTVPTGNRQFYFDTNTDHLSFGYFGSSEASFFVVEENKRYILISYSDSYEAFTE